MGEDGLTYRDAGVDVEAGDAFVEAIREDVASTERSGSMGGIGGFGGLFDLKAAGYDDPLLVSATDGVGTKLRLAIEAGRHHEVGVDLVAMCVNDLVCQGAEPLFFLDYMASGRLDSERGAAVVHGIADGCRQAGCALVGGETAEMPGMYAAEDYDLAGFAVGAVERDAVLPTPCKPGSVLLGCASSGVHSNGFSLVRKVVERAGLGWRDAAPFATGETLAEALLTPTRIYVRSALAAAKVEGLRAFAHITGGGLHANVARVTGGGVPGIDAGSWPRPPVFRWLAEAGGIAEEEMLRTFNCGIGFVAVCAPEAEAEVRQALEDAGETVFRIGEVEGA